VTTDAELVTRVFSAWNRGDLEAFAAHAAPDIKWVEVQGRPEVGELHGREVVKDALGSLYEAWENYRLEPEEVREVGSRVLAVVREVARARRSGLTIGSLWGYVITIRDAKVVRVEAYRDPSDARAALGLCEEPPPQP